MAIFPYENFPRDNFQLVFAPRKHIDALEEHSEQDSLYLSQQTMCERRSICIDFLFLCLLSQDAKIREVFSYQEATRSRDTKSEIPFQPSVTFSSHSSHTLVTLNCDLWERHAMQLHTRPELPEIKTFSDTISYGILSRARYLKGANISAFGASDSN